MAIIINNFEIQDNGQSLNINIQTEPNSIITSVLLWNNETFDAVVDAIDLNYKLTQTNNIESFIVTAQELSISSFNDIWFLQIESNFLNNCGNLLEPTIGITYDFSNYYKCLLNKYFKSMNFCKGCNEEKIDHHLLSISLTIDIIEKSLIEGFYTQAITLLNKLKKLCNITKCNNCENKQIECSNCK